MMKRNFKFNIYILLLISSCCVSKPIKYNHEIVYLKKIIDIERETLNIQCEFYGYSYLVDEISYEENNPELKQILNLEQDTLFVVHIISDFENILFLNRNKKTICIENKNNSNKLFIFSEKINTKIKLCMSRESGDNCYCPYSSNEVVVITKFFRHEGNIKFLSSYYCEEIRTKIFPDTQDIEKW